MKLVHWLLMGRLLNLVQRGGDWAGPQLAQAPPRCTKCNSPPINGQCLLCGFNAPVEGLDDTTARGLSTCTCTYICICSLSAGVDDTTARGLSTCTCTCTYICICSLSAGVDDTTARGLSTCTCTCTYICICSLSAGVDTRLMNNVIYWLNITIA